MGVDLPISGLPEALPLDDADLFAVVQGGVTDKATLGQVRDALAPLQEIRSAIVDLELVQDVKTSGNPSQLDLLNGTHLYGNFSVGFTASPLTRFVAFLTLRLRQLLSAPAGGTVTVTLLANGAAAFTPSQTVFLGAFNQNLIEDALSEVTLQAVSNLIQGDVLFETQIDYTDADGLLKIFFGSSIMVQQLPTLRLTTESFWHPLLVVLDENGDTLVTEAGDIILTE